jgi:phosphohistidine phosphatase
MERDEWAREGKSDELRPLTKKGIGRFAEASRGLLTQVPQLHTINTSPLLRSLQTAEILGLCYPGVKIAMAPELAPEGPRERVKSLITSLMPGKVHALIGHRPDLEQIASTLLIGNDSLIFKIKKGGAALLELEQGKWQLLWLLNQKQLCELD